MEAEKSSLSGQTLNMLIKLRFFSDDKNKSA